MFNALTRGRASRASNVLCSQNRLEWGRNHKGITTLKTLQYIYLYSIKSIARRNSNFSIEQKKRFLIFVSKRFFQISKFSFFNLYSYYITFSLSLSTTIFSLGICYFMTIAAFLIKGKGKNFEA